jgi:hypothetical protein
MRKLCVFYKNAAAYLGKPIVWIVCRECQDKLRAGKRLTRCEVAGLSAKEIIIGGLEQLDGARRIE